MEFIGKVVSKKMEKTAVVEVERFVTHPLYKKRIRKKRKFKAHDLLGTTLGNKVKIRSCRPISKEKHFEVVEIIKK